MSASSTSRTPRHFPGLLLAILALAAAVRWLVVGRDALWLDEGYSWWDAGQRFRALWTLVPTCDPHPPLYFAVLHGWISLFGDDTVTMRTLSVLLGLATVVIVYVAGRQLDRARGAAGERFGIGFLAALLFALTPFQVYFSVEARPYALLCFGAALLTFGCLLTVRAGLTLERRMAFSWTNRVSPGGWAALLIGGVIVVWTNNTAVLVLGAASVGFIAMWLFDRDSRKTIAPVIAAGVVIALLWAPDWPLLYAQSKEVTGDFWIPKPTFEGLTFELHNLIGLDVLRSTWWVALAILGGLLAIGRSIGWRWTLMVGALATLPIIFNVAISYLLSPILLSRALIGAAPALAIALAASAMLLRPRALRIAAACALVVVHAISLQRYLAADHVKEPWRPVVARLAVEAQQAPLLVVPNELVLPLMHEAKMERLALRARGLPADYPATDMKARYPSGKCAPSVIDQDLTPLIDSLRNENTVVLLTRLNNTYDPNEAIAAALKQAGYKLRNDDVFQPGDLRIMRFVRGTS
jgi:4-amino-4-deoxy-L-arabinose transferase-like glycosyltransferase